MVLERIVQPGDTAMGSVRGLCLNASGDHGECRRQRREDHASGEQEYQRATYYERTNHASDFSKYRSPAKCARYD